MGKYIENLCQLGKYIENLQIDIKKTHKDHYYVR